MITLEVEFFSVDVGFKMLMAFVVGRVLYRTPWSSDKGGSGTDGWSGSRTVACGGIYLAGGCDRRLDSQQPVSRWQSLVLAVATRSRCG